MKINKLLFFLLALVSLNSCVEYVHNGIVPDGPEPPEEQKFTAVHSNPEEAKYIGDKFEFTAMLNSVDVTKSTKFKVSGTTISGNTYTPAKTGSHTVIATMDNYTATFKFVVEEKDEEEPQPTGNRIEYGGKSYSLDTTYFILNGTSGSNGTTVPNLTMLDGTTPALNWMLINFDGTDPSVATNIYLIEVLVPFDGSNITYPFETTQIDVLDGSVEINGAAPFSITNMGITFASTGNSRPTQSVPGNANYTSTATGASSGNLAELFWEGEYIRGVQAWNKGAKGSGFKKLDISKLKILNKTQIKNLKIAK